VREGGGEAARGEGEGVGVKDDGLAERTATRSAILGKAARRGARRIGKDISTTHELLAKVKGDGCVGCGTSSHKLLERRLDALETVLAEAVRLGIR